MLHRRSLILLCLLVFLLLQYDRRRGGALSSLLTATPGDPLRVGIVVKRANYSLQQGLPDASQFASEGEWISGEEITSRLRERLTATLLANGRKSDQIKRGPQDACKLSRELRVRYAPLQHKRVGGRWMSGTSRGGIFLSMTLHNNEDILINLFDQIVRLIFHLNRHDVHVSVYENGSSDLTTILLAHFGSALQALGVDHTIIHSDATDNIVEKPWRIAKLADYRNRALAPMLDSRVPLPAGTAGGWDLFLSLNDVVGCVQDFLEVIYQKEMQAADMTCAWDWHSLISPEFESPGVLLLYDNWVTRSVTGQFPYHIDVVSGIWTLPSESFSQLGDEYTKTRVKAGLPSRVYSCYNGFIATSAKFFTPVANGGLGLLWRAARSWDSSLAARVSQLQLNGHTRIVDESKKYTPISNETYWKSEESAEEQLKIGPESPGECPASECTLLCKDMHRASVRSRGHAARIAVVPQANLAYDESDYSRLQARKLPFQPWSQEKLDWEAEEQAKWAGHGKYGLPSKVKCFPWGVEGAVGFWKYGVWVPPI